MGGRQRKKVLKKNIDFCFLRSPKLHHALLPCLFQSLVVAAGPSWPYVALPLPVFGAGCWVFVAFLVLSLSPALFFITFSPAPCLHHFLSGLVSRRLQSLRLPFEEAGPRSPGPQHQRLEQAVPRRPSPQHQRLEEAGPRRPSPPSTKDWKRQGHEGPATTKDWKRQGRST